MNSPSAISIEIPATQEGWITRLTLAQPCPGCGGVGMVYCKAWASWEEERVRTGALPQPEPNCPEEEPCRECDGEGLVATRAGRAIVELVAKAFKVERR